MSVGVVCVLTLCQYVGGCCLCADPVYVGGCCLCADSVCMSVGSLWQRLKMSADPVSVCRWVQCGIGYMNADPVSVCWCVLSVY